jgi:chemotaxis protein MotB
MREKLRKIVSKRADAPSSGGGWEVVYSGFILIMLCFFIMLSSFASIEEGKVVRFVKSFVNSVSILSGGLKFEPGQRVIRDSADIVDKESQLAQVFQDVKLLRDSLGLDKKVDISFSKKGLVMRISDTVLFDMGAASMSEEAVILMKNVAQIISKTSHAIRIEGHTDNLPIHTDQFPSNWELSTARAVNVLRYFIGEGKIAASRLSAVGFGEFQPIFPNDTAEHRAKNRRVEIVLVRQEPDKVPTQGVK